MFLFSYTIAVDAEFMFLDQTDSNFSMVHATGKGVMTRDCVVELVDLQDHSAA